jgi:hypothetical protein
MNKSELIRLLNEIEDDDEVRVQMAGETQTFGIHEVYEHKLNNLRNYVAIIIIRDEENA